VPFDELPPEIAHVVTLNGHGMRLAGLDDRSQGRVEIADAIGEGIVRIVNLLTEFRAKRGQIGSPRA
jgi:hypothetical protein